MMKSLPVALVCALIPSISHSAAPAPQRNVTVTSPELLYHRATRVGPVKDNSGCPNGVTTTLIKEDAEDPNEGTKLVLFWDNFELQTTPQKVKVNKKCTLMVPVTVPTGMQLLVFRPTYRGSAYITQGAKARIQVRYGLRDRDSFTETVPVIKDLIGPMEEPFLTLPPEEDMTTSSRAPATERMPRKTFEDEVKLVSNCGGNVQLYIEMAATVWSNERREDQLLTIDTMDTVSHPGVQAVLKYQKCRARR